MKPDTSLEKSAIIVATLRRLEGEWVGAQGESLDIRGSFMYAVSILALIYGALLLPRVAALHLIIFGLVGLGILIRYEIKTPDPEFEVRLFHQMVNRPMILNPHDR